MTKSNGIQTALETSDIHDKEMISKIKRVEDELNLTPWNLTHNFIRAMQGRSMLQLTGFGAPLKGNHSLSFINLPLKVQQSKQKQKQANIPKSAVTGTDADLRKLSLEDSRKTLLKFGVSEDEIARMKRWKRIDKVRELSSAAANAQGDGGPITTKFARGTRHSTEQQKQEYKAKAQKIFEAQLNFISNTEIDGDYSSSDSDSDEDMLFASIAKSMNKNQQQQLDEQQQQQQQQQAALDATDQQNKLNLEVPQVNSTPRPANPPPGTTWIKKVTRIPNNDGTITLRTEIIRDLDKVEELKKKMKQNRQPNVKAHASAEDEQLKTQKRRERRRLQERLRRLKKNSEKQRKLQEQLINGTGDGTVVSCVVPLTCGACGMTGHMRTNRTCPLYRDREQNKSIAQVSGTKIKISSQMLDTINENEEMGNEKLTISIPKKVIEEVDRLDEPDRKPKKVQRGRRTKTQLQIALNNVFEQITKKLQIHDASYLFRVAVNEKQGAPGYYDIVKYPMHLSLIHSKCRDGKYATLDDFMIDINLIVSNCQLYNTGRNDYLLPFVDKFKDAALEIIAEVCSY